MTDPRDELDQWVSAQVRPLPPPPRTFELIRKRARRRKVTRAAIAAAGVAAAIAVVATVPRLAISQLSPSPAAQGAAAGQTESSGASVQQSPATSTPVPTPAVSAEPAAPPNFAATSVTFVGASTGWVLGQAGTPGHCGPPSPYICTSLAVTSDGGSTWHGVHAPVTGAPDGSTGVSEIRFLNTADGWAFGPELWATHDGGQTWAKINTGGLRVTALETVGNRAFAVWAQCTGTGTAFAAQCTAFSLYSAAAGGDQWTPVPGAAADLAASPAGSSTAAAASASSTQLVLTSKQGYLLAPSGELLSGPVTGQGRWQPAAGSGTSGAPCKPGAAQNDGQPAGGMLAATTASGLVLACAGQAANGSQPKLVYTSADGGQTWQQTGPVSAQGTVTSVAGTTTGTIILATTAGIEVWASGGSWTAAQGALPVGGFRYVGMTTPQQGVAVPVNASLHAVWFTYDGGKTWQKSPIG